MDLGPFIRKGSVLYKLPDEQKNQQENKPTFNQFTIIDFNNLQSTHENEDEIMIQNGKSTKLQI